MRLEHKSNITYLDDYNIWIKRIEDQFQSDEDPIYSAIEYIKYSESLTLIYTQTFPVGNGILTIVWNRIIRKFQTTKVLIDSTCKTNIRRFALFVIMVSAMGVGFPLAYFFLEISDTRYSSIAKNVHNCVYELSLWGFVRVRILMFLTDTEKDKSEINAIQIPFRTTPCLCLWHMNRAINHKV